MKSYEWSSFTVIKLSSTNSKLFNHKTPYTDYNILTDLNFGV